MCVDVLIKTGEMRFKQERMKLDHGVFVNSLLFADKQIIFAKKAENKLQRVYGMSLPITEVMALSSCLGQDVTSSICDVMFRGIRAERRKTF